MVGDHSRVCDAADFSPVIKFPKELALFQNFEIGVILNIVWLKIFVSMRKDSRKPVL